MKFGYRPLFQRGAYNRWETVLVSSLAYIRDFTPLQSGAAGVHVKFTCFFMT